MKIDYDTVYTIKMASSEELVTKISEETETHYVINKPATLGQDPSTGGIQLIPALYSADHEKPVWINKAQVAMVVPTKKATSDSYIEATTGIKPVTQQIILG